MFFIHFSLSAHRQQLLYLSTSSCACQQLFSFFKILFIDRFSNHLCSKQLVYTTIPIFICQQVFWIFLIFCVFYIFLSINTICDTRVSNLKCRLCSHNKAFKLGTRQTWGSSDLRSKSANFECLKDCRNCVAMEQSSGITRVPGS